MRSKVESNVGIIYPHEVKFDTIFDVPHVVKMETGLKIHWKKDPAKSSKN